MTTGRPLPVVLATANAIAHRSGDRFGTAFENKVPAYVSIVTIPMQTAKHISRDIVNRARRDDFDDTVDEDFR